MSRPTRTERRRAQLALKFAALEKMESRNLATESLGMLTAGIGLPAALAMVRPAEASQAVTTKPRSATTHRLAIGADCDPTNEHDRVGWGQFVASDLRSFNAGGFVTNDRGSDVSECGAKGERDHGLVGITGESSQGWRGGRLVARGIGFGVPAGAHRFAGEPGQSIRRFLLGVVVQHGPDPAGFDEFLFVVTKPDIIAGHPGRSRFEHSQRLGSR